MAITYDNAPVVRMIPVGAIKPNPYQTRKFMDVTSVSDLADSIKEFGLIEPLILTFACGGNGRSFRSALYCT